jgi:hypothetical protein
MSDSVTTTVAVPVGSAGRVGMRKGQVSELTGILPLKPGGADRLRGKLAEDPPTRTPSCGTCTAASGSPRPSMRYSTHPRSEIQPVPAVLRYARNTKPPTQKRTPCFSRGSALTGRGEEVVVTRLRTGRPSKHLTSPGVADKRKRLDRASW